MKKITTKVDGMIGVLTMTITVAMTSNRVEIHTIIRRKAAMKGRTVIRQPAPNTSPLLRIHEKKLTSGEILSPSMYSSKEVEPYANTAPLLWKQLRGMKESHHPVVYAQARKLFKKS